MPRLRELGESEALRRLIAARRAAGGVVLGPGDDAAVLAPSPAHDLVATTDAFIEGRHFLPTLGTPEDHGARLAAANLSDLAAMAARPRWALLSMGLRPDHDMEALLAFQVGVMRPLETHGAAVVGGNLTAVDGAEWFDLTLLGEAPRGQAWTRGGARSGDLLAVTGWPGRAGAALRLEMRLGDAARRGEWQALLDAWLCPVPRVALALALAATGGVRAAIDVSDGVAGDLARLCEASGVGAELDPGAWPQDPLLVAAAAALELAPDELRFGPSDDYELILAVAPDRRVACASVAVAHGVPMTFVGRIGGGPGTITLGARGRSVMPRGFDHFRTG